jgi:hypothetical protein
MPDLLGELKVSKDKMKITMNRIALNNGKATWTQPDSVTVSVPSANAAVTNPKRLNTVH